MPLDLNLLTALDALLKEGSVGGAARRLHVTSPAMSRTLNRIRDATGDLILVRTGRHMSPTPHALALRDEVHALVQQANGLLAPRRAFDLAQLQRVFTIQCHDAVASAVTGPLLDAVQAQAPGVRLRLLAEGPVDTQDLRHGQVDLEIGNGVAPQAEISQETLGHDRLLVAMRAGHPLARCTLTLPRYAEALHLIVSRRGRLSDPIDALLEAQGRKRQVVASAPTSTAALLAVSTSDWLVVVPEVACRPMLHRLQLKTAPLPLKLPPLALNCAWHRRYEQDPAHLWLRGQVREIIQRLVAACVEDGFVLMRGEGSLFVAGLNGGT